ncbi:MAG: polysaccharide deacetylase family protein [Ornithinimicrobium sp.]
MTKQHSSSEASRARGVARAGVRAAKAGMGVARVGTAIESFAAADVVAITYDDGPDAHATESILQVLRDRAVKATFFVLMTRVYRYPEVLEAIRDEGHEIAFHGLDHTDLATLRPVEVRRRLHDGIQSLEDAAQVPVRWFRPPYVSLSLAGWARSRPLECEFVASASSFRDWNPISDAQRLQLFAAEVKAGDVVLAHDSWPTADDGAFDGPEPEIDRAALTAGALDVLEAAGMRQVTLSEAAAQGKARRPVRTSLRSARPGRHRGSAQ